MSYGDVLLSPALFQDDVSRMCQDPLSAQMGNDRMEAMAETKLLDFNMDKSCLIIIGQGKARKVLEDQFDENPPLLYGQKMKRVTCEKYLGDQISSGGMAESVIATINKRKGKVIQSIFEISTLMEDCRGHVTGGITTALEIWEMAVCPYLLNNCDTWCGVTDSAIEELDKLQNLFYRVILQVPVGCPIPMMYWDCGGFLMSNRILRSKLNLLHHIATLSPSSLAYQVYSTQDRLCLPGLVQECQQMLINFEITDVTKFSKCQWKNLISRKMKTKNTNDLISKMKSGYKKIDHKLMAGENFELKPYFKNLHISQARTKFRLRSFMTKTVKLNFASDKKFAADLWTCWHCPMVDSQAHVRICPAYQHLRAGKNLDNDQDLVRYFTQVIKFRDDMTN